MGVVVVATCAAAGLGLWGIACLSSHDRSFFFAFRALELRFGSSPTWPVAASLGALALFAFVHLTRFYLVACQKPDVITEGLSNGLEYRLHEAWGDFNSGLESFLGLRRASQNRHSMGLIFFG